MFRFLCVLRVLVLYLGNLYSLIIALLDKVNSMSSAVSVPATSIYLWFCAVVGVTCPFLVLQLQLSPGNWTDSSSFLATISQPETDSLSTLMSEISEHHNSTVATIVTVNFTSRSRSSGAFYNQTSLFEKNTRSQQDQCWETYVGQVRPPQHLNLTAVTG